MKRFYTKRFTIVWTDRVDMSVVVEAETEERAIEMVRDMDPKKFQEENIEYLVEPHVQSEEEI